MPLPPVSPRPTKKRLTTSPSSSNGQPRSPGFLPHWWDDKLHSVSSQNRVPNENKGQRAPQNSSATDVEKGYVSTVYGGLVDDDSQDITPPPPAQIRRQSPMVRRANPPPCFPLSLDQFYAFTSSLEAEAGAPQSKGAHDDSTHHSDSDSDELSEDTPGDSSHDLKSVPRPNLKASLPPTLSKKPSSQDNSAISKDTTAQGGATTRKPSSTLDTLARPKMPLESLSHPTVPTKVPTTHGNLVAESDGNGTSGNTTAHKGASVTLMVDLSQL
ncbi:hypothetical protein JVT61DRAFT_7266 [Boletus reticuloceps]|uniref:Uncharacterized protein n=1 Tax=Boletus reticuloceps TaxID=495285 RepID=A0A8I3A678_9AGAM|nr:hypothetical protein JVT61DRAFT_7266 [Boletus reticuloceps]